jgi:hypothetical protein
MATKEQILEIETKLIDAVRTLTTCATAGWEFERCERRIDLMLRVLAIFKTT